MNQGLSDASVAALIAEALRPRGFGRVFGRCGTRIMPIRLRADTENFAFAGVRDERAAAQITQAHAEVNGRSPPSPA
jgi:thiamine pyrophosphate-dependent acetolactate synthase large subunit-like protein